MKKFGSTENGSSALLASSDAAVPRTDTTMGCPASSTPKALSWQKQERKPESSGEAESHPSTVEKVISLSCSSRYRYDTSSRQTPQLQLGLTRIAAQSLLLISNWLKKKLFPCQGSVTKL